MTYFKENFSVPKEWRRVLASMLEALTADPELSAIRYIIQHKKDKALLDLLVAKQFIKHDPLEDRFSLHLMGLLTADGACASEWKKDIESIFLNISTHFENHPKSAITLQDLFLSYNKDYSRFLTCIYYIIDMGIFSRSTDLTENNAWIQPTPSILDFENVASLWKKQGPVWFAGIKSSGVQINNENKLGNEKSRREKRLKVFLVDINNRAKEHGFNWDRQSIPATKKQFADVFFRINPDLSPKSDSTLRDHAKDLGACFQPGTSQKEATEFYALFQEELQKT